MARERLHFIGVSTGGSSMRGLFPRWAELLGIDAELVGRDLAVGAEGGAFRAAVAEVAADPGIRGALVTTHKVSVYAHALDLFAELEPDARLCREISCIAKRGDGGLVGSATDPVAAGRTLEEMLGNEYWRRTGGHVLCLGGGGAGTAISVYLARLAAPPAQVVVADTSRERLEALRAVHDELGSGLALTVATVASAADADRLLARLPPRSLVVNATGLGKDAAGSPVSSAAVFPEGGVAWDLNYRGELVFLDQAQAQAGERGLVVQDGWRYFVRGWAAVLESVFALTISEDKLAELASAAEPFRPRRW